MTGVARRFLFTCGLAGAMVFTGSAAAFACGGLVAPGHAEVLQKATTLAAWHAGYEHYVTGFQFAGNANGFGYIIPLPGVPTKIQKAGNWTLERLEREINPVRLEAVDAAAPTAFAGVQVIQRTRVDALDITVVRGGGKDVAAWGRANGFDLTPDTPTVLGRYSSAGDVFALAKFNGLAAQRQGLIQGQGTVIHFTIPTPRPWIPLRILALGKPPTEVVNADLFLLTDHRPILAPRVLAEPGVDLRTSEEAPSSLLADLRSDRGMSWLPARGMWFTAITLHTPAVALTADLTVGPGSPVPGPSPARWMVPLAAAALILAMVAAGLGGRRGLNLQPS